MFYNKKGDVFQQSFLLIFLFITAVIGLIFLKLTTGVLDAYDQAGLFPENSTSEQTNDILEQSAPKTTDYMIFFMFLFGNIGILISASRTRFSPTVIGIFILLTIVTIFVAAGFVNIYQGFATSDALSDVGSQLTLTNFVFSRYTPLVMCVMSAFIMFLMWSKSGGDIVG